MSSIKGYADGPFGQIHYKMAGDGIPLILCHQSFTSHIQFEAGLAPLAKAGIQAIAMDIPGFGMSDTPDAPPNIAEYAACLPPLLDHLGLNSANLLGHHSGACLVTEASLLWPDRFPKIIQNGPVNLTPEEQQQFIDTAVAREKAWHKKEDGSHLMDLWEQRTGATPGWTDLTSMSRQVIHALLGAEKAWYLHNAVFAYDHGEAMGRMTQPNLILTNTGDGIYFLAQRAKEQFPHFAYAEQEGGTHDIVDEQPEAWAKAIVDFLKS